MRVCYPRFHRCPLVHLSSSITEVFSVAGCKNNNVRPVNPETRLDREEYWIETLRIILSLNERKRKTDPNLSVGCSFPPILRSRKTSSRCRNNVNFHKLKDMGSKFNCIHNYITDEIKSAFYHKQIILNNLGKKDLKKIDPKILLNGPFIRTDLIQFQYHPFIFDTIDTILYKPEQKNGRKDT